MKTYPIREGGDQMFAFEIGNAYLGVSMIADLLRESGKVTDLKRRGQFADSGDAHLEFKYGGVHFIVWEPYGDSSRYWIGPKSEGDRPLGVEELEAIFARYQLPRWRKVAGDLLTFNFKALVGGE